MEATCTDGRQWFQRELFNPIMEHIQTGFRGHILINNNKKKTGRPVSELHLYPQSPKPHINGYPREYLTRAHIKRHKTKEWRDGHRRTSESYWNACLRFKVPGGGLTFYSWTVSFHRQWRSTENGRSVSALLENNSECARRLASVLFHRKANDNSGRHLKRRNSRY